MSEERLKQLANGDKKEFDRVGYSEVCELAAALLAAQERVRELEAEKTKDRINELEGLQSLVCDSCWETLEELKEYAKKETNG